MTYINARTLETERLLLLPVTPAIYNTVLRWYDDDAIKAFFAITTDEGLTAEKERYKQGVTAFNRSFMYYLLAQKDTEKIIGWCGYHSWYIFHHRAEIGYWLYDEECKKQGFMKEAIAPILRAGFEEMKLRRIEAYTAEENTASRKVLTGAGFMEEGRMRENYCEQGVNEDSIVFSLLKREWEIKK